VRWTGRQDAQYQRVKVPAEHVSLHT
jgi:hypothetical protein